MKRVLSIASLVFSFALAVSLSAQTPPTAGMKIASDADYATHMKEIGQLNGVLNKSIKAFTFWCELSSFDVFKCCFVRRN